MSRGPGAFQRRVMEALATYHRLGASLGWKWPGGRMYSGATYAGEGSIYAYERGRYVHVWMLLRDLDCTADKLSRALKSLERKELVLRYAGDLEHLDGSYHHKACKFARLTDEGEAWLKRQEIHCVKVGAYQAHPRPGRPEGPG